MRNKRMAFSVTIRMHRTEIIHNKNEYKMMFLGIYAAFTVALALRQSV